MENNEIVNTEELTAIAEDIAEVEKMPNGFGGKAAAVGIGVLAGMLIYKYAVIPLSLRIKAKKAAKNAVCDTENDSDEFDETLE